MSSVQLSANDSLLVNSKWTLLYTLILHGDTIQRNGKSYIRENTEIGTGNNGGPTIFFKKDHTFVKIKPTGEKNYSRWSINKDTLIIQQEHKTKKCKKKNEILKYIISFETKKELILYLSPVVHQKTKYVFGKSDDNE